MGSELFCNNLVTQCVLCQTTQLWCQHQYLTLQAMSSYSWCCFLLMFLSINSNDRDAEQKFYMIRVLMSWNIYWLGYLSSLINDYNDELISVLSCYLGNFLCILEIWRTLKMTMTMSGEKWVRPRLAKMNAGAVQETQLNSMLYIYYAN